MLNVPAVTHKVLSEISMNFRLIEREYQISGTNDSTMVRNTHGTTPSLLVIEDQITWLNKLIFFKALGWFVNETPTLRVRYDSSVEIHREETFIEPVRNRLLFR